MAAEVSLPRKISLRLQGIPKNALYPEGEARIEDLENKVECLESERSELKTELQSWKAKSENSMVNNNI